MNSLSTSTYYNPFQAGSPRSREHWANFINDATLAKYQIDALASFVETVNRERIEAIDAATKRVSGTSPVGFGAVPGGLSALADRIRSAGRGQVIADGILPLGNDELSEANESSNQIDQRLSLKVECRRVGSVLQENLAQLLGIDESQKERENHIHAGLRFLKNAWKDSDLYYDALKELSAAESLAPEDYFVLHRLGMLYLYAPPVVDLAKAADYLARAGKQAAVESDPRALRLESVLRGTRRARFAEQPSPPSTELSFIAADSYHHAAVAHHALGKLPEALKLIDTAVILEPAADAHRFFRAKYFAAAGEADQALRTLKTLPATTALMNVAMSDLDLLKGVAVEWAATVEAHKERLLGAIRPLADRIGEARTKYTGLSRALENDKAAERVLSFAKADAKSAMEVADYVEGAFLDDRASLDRAELLVERVEEMTVEVIEKVPTGEVLKVPTGEVESVPTGETETYFAEVIVKPATLFRNATVARVERTRPVLVEKPVCRDEPVLRDERRKRVVPGALRLALVNAYGELKTSFPGGWVEIPSGAFQMGEPGRTKEVTLTRRFKMLSVPMTQGLYRHLMGENPSRFEGDGRPVEQVGWSDAVRCCNAFSIALGLPEAYAIRDKKVYWEGLSHLGVRLPTEAEWEYACRAGTAGDYAGNLDEMGWYDQNSGGETHPVGQKKPNAWGLYDMHGNVCEWCWDWYGDNLPGGTDPIGPATGSHRVFRGGSWGVHAICCRAANRHLLHPSYRADDFGFRPVLPTGQ